MKLKIVLIAIIMVFSAFSSSAEVVTFEKAKKVAVNCYFEKAYQAGFELNIHDVVLQKDYTIQHNGTNSYFVFTFNAPGFVIISAEDVLPPVLGYSLENEYINENQPDSYRNFMQTYSDAIAYIRENLIGQEESVQQLWEYYLAGSPEDFIKSKASKGVDPLLMCLWDQGYPYNALCPESPTGPGGHVYAGCVATAMAQVMYYWRYPLHGTGSHAYYYPPYGNISANFGATEYQWEGMLNTITYDQPDPIAELQFHCGVGVEMMYGPNGSGAYSSDVPPALENFFGYSTDCYYTWKDDHSNSEWINMLKDNIDNGWPMYYSGFSNAGGHAFVCDGYDGDLFHFNFGWSGSSNGFYTLLSVGGFNSGQGAVFDTYPATGFPYFCTGDHTLTYMKGSIEDGSGPVADYQNNSNCSWLIDPQTSEDSVSSITINFFAFETAINDVLAIYDGSTTQDNLLGEFSGNQIPDPLTSTSNKVLIVFTSDGSNTGQGWQLQYVANSPDYCKGVTILEEETGSLSDGSGNFNYQDNSSCMWKILPPSAEAVTLFFTEFETETDKDRVFIYDLESQQLLAEYSGSYSVSNPPPPVTSYSGKMFVAFSTNSSINSAGWNAYFAPGTTGIESLSQGSKEIKLYPNPASELIHIEMPDYMAESFNISLVSITGKTLLSKVTEPSTENSYYLLDVAGFPRGIYMVKISSNSKSVIKRIVLQ